MYYVLLLLAFFSQSVAAQAIDLSFPGASSVKTADVGTHVEHRVSYGVSPTTDHVGEIMSKSILTPSQTFHEIVGRGRSVGVVMPAGSPPPAFEVAFSGADGRKVVVFMCHGYFVTPYICSMRAE